MKYLLDSNIIIALTMNRIESVVRRAAECNEGDMVTSAIAIAEVAFGSHRGDPPAVEQLHGLRHFAVSAGKLRPPDRCTCDFSRPDRRHRQ